jgi:predicted ABC-type ATPase
MKAECEVDRAIRSGAVPGFHLVAGPNGAGKTTFARRYLPRYAGTLHFLNADLIAAGLAPFQPEAAALSAGKILLGEFRRLARKRKSFAAESTLAGAGLAPRLQALRKAGYRLHLHFLWLPSVDLALARVRARVRAGGHDIPEETVRRRFAAGLENLRGPFAAIFDDVRLFDNSGARPRLVARRSAGRWTVRDRECCRVILETTP